MSQRKKAAIRLPNIRKLLRHRGDSSRRKKPGHSPHAPVHVGAQRTDSLSIRAIQYRGDEISEIDSADIADCVDYKNSDQLAWLHLSGLHEVDKVTQLTEAAGIHALVTEDILNTRHRPKIEEFDDYVFVTAKLLHQGESGHIDVQHFCLLLFDSTVMTFSEAPTEAFEPVLKRIRNGRGRIRHQEADYLAWAILDAVIDHYFAVIDLLEDSLNELDDNLQTDFSQVDIGHLYATKAEVSSLYRMVRPIREIVTALGRSESQLFSDSSRPFFRDLYDHGLHVIESTDDLRDFAASLRDFHQTAAGNHMNQIMKVLTCAATIFLPLTFLAGIYGMNFEHMPELSVPWAYPALWGMFISLGVGMLWMFRRKKWL